MSHLLSWPGTTYLVTVSQIYIRDTKSCGREFEWHLQNSQWNSPIAWQHPEPTMQAPAAFWQACQASHLKHTQTLQQQAEAHFDHTSRFFHVTVAQLASLACMWPLLQDSPLHTFCSQLFDHSFQSNVSPFDVDARNVDTFNVLNSGSSSHFQFLLCSSLSWINNRCC